MAQLKTRQQIREEFGLHGQSITKWAKDRGYTPNTVIAILADNETTPRYKCLRGEAHDIAVSLGLKAGKITSKSSPSAHAFSAAAA